MVSLKSEEAVAVCLYQRSEGFRIEHNFFATQLFPNFRLGHKLTDLNKRAEMTRISILSVKAVLLPKYRIWPYLGS